MCENCESTIRKVVQEVDTARAEVSIMKAAAAAPELTGEERERQAISDEGYAFASVLSALASLTPEARARILRWANERFRPVSAMSGPSPQVHVSEGVPLSPRLDASRREAERIVDEVHEAHGMPS